MNNSPLLIINKPVGKTPFEIIQDIKETYPELKNTKIGYAGRLDPMAEGILLLLLGDENKKKHKYENLSKTYECEILLGFSTDTYDLMGIVMDQYSGIVISNFSSLQKKIRHILSQMRGERVQYYPPYSSARVNGKPLFYWARKTMLDCISIPSRHVHIDDISLLSFSFITHTDLIQHLKMNISQVKGDFRQEEIIHKWECIEQTNNEYPLVKIKVDCSSGTYIRSIANEIGGQLGIPALAFSIKRTRVGDYTSETNINSLITKS